MALYTTAADRRGGRLAVLDAAVAVAAFAATMAVAWRGTAFSDETRGVDWIDGRAGGVRVAAARACWRRSPLGVFALTTAASAVLFGIGSAVGPPFGPTIALYLLAASRDDAHPWTRRTTAVVVGLFVAHVGAAGAGQSEVPAAPLLFGVLVWTIAWFAGDRTRMRRERLAAAEDSLARERRLATVEERARIARDLHDSAGHAINVILVQAGAARLLQERDPAGARAALETIEEVARDTIGEIDALVRTLRDDQRRRTACSTRSGSRRSARSSSATGRRPRRRGRDDGHRAAARRHRGRAAYRIVQESLTNASRYGPGGARSSSRSATAGWSSTVDEPVAPGARRLAGRARPHRHARASAARRRLARGRPRRRGVPRPRAAADVTPDDPRPSSSTTTT